MSAVDDAPLVAVQIRVVAVDLVDLAGGQRVHASAVRPVAGHHVDRLQLVAIFDRDIRWPDQVGQGAVAGQADHLGLRLLEGERDGPEDDPDNERTEEQPSHDDDLRNEKDWICLSSLKRGKSSLSQALLGAI